MKAIVLEVKNGVAAVLCEDGVVTTTRQSCQVGQVIEVSAAVTRFPSRRGRIMRTAVAAAIALAITGGTYTYTNVAAASYVTLDTEETSVELSVNRMGRVVGVRALDEESVELAEALYPEVRRLSVEDAVNAAMTRLGDAQTVVAGVTGDTQRHTAALHEAVERGVERAERGDMELVTLEVSREDRREADEHDMSAGRYVFERSGGFEKKDDAESGSASEPTTASESVPAIAPDKTPEPAPENTPKSAPENVPAEPPTAEPSAEVPAQQPGRDDAAQQGEYSGDRPEPPEARPDDGQQPTDTRPPQSPEASDPPQQMPETGQQPDGEQPPQAQEGGTQPPSEGVQPMQQPFGNMQAPSDGGRQPSQGEAFGAAPGGMQPPPGGMGGVNGAVPQGGMRR